MGSKTAEWMNRAARRQKMDMGVYQTQTRGADDKDPHSIYQLQRKGSESSYTESLRRKESHSSFMPVDPRRRGSESVYNPEPPRRKGSETAYMPEPPRSKGSQITSIPERPRSKGSQITSIPEQRPPIQWTESYNTSEDPKSIGGGGSTWTSKLRRKASSTSFMPIDPRRQASENIYVPEPPPRSTRREDVRPQELPSRRERNEINATPDLPPPRRKESLANPAQQPEPCLIRKTTTTVQTSTPPSRKQTLAITVPEPERPLSQRRQGNESIDTTTNSFSDTLISSSPSGSILSTAASSLSLSHGGNEDFAEKLEALQLKLRSNNAQIQANEARMRVLDERDKEVSSGIQEKLKAVQGMNERLSALRGMLARVEEVAMG